MAAESEVGLDPFFSDPIPMPRFLIGDFQAVNLQNVYSQCRRIWIQTNSASLIVHLSSYYFRHYYNLKHNCISVSSCVLSLSHRFNWPCWSKWVRLNKSKGSLPTSPILWFCLHTHVNEMCSSSSNKTSVSVKVLPS